MRHLSSPALGAAGVVIASMFTPHAHAATVSFVSDSYSVAEDASQAVATVRLSEPPAASVFIYCSTEGGTATETVDYVGLSIGVQWDIGDPQDKEVAIDLFDDEFYESDESFTVTIISFDGADPGDFVSTTVTLLDDDFDGAPLEPTIDVGDAFADPAGDYWFAGYGGQDLPITIRLNRVPEAPVSLRWTSTMVPWEGSVTFDGVDEATVVFSPWPGPEPFRVESFSLETGPMPGGLDHILDLRAAILFAESGGAQECALCGVAGLLRLTSLGDCPLGCQKYGICDWSWPLRLLTRGGGELSRMVTVLQRYRDEILAGTEEGQYYIARYDDLSPQIWRAVLGRPTFFYRVHQAIPDWIDALEALVDGTGDGVVITQDMEDRLNALLDEFEELGSAELTTFIDAQRTQLQVDAIAGYTVQEFQDQVEKLGGDTPVESATWSKLKARYR